MYVSYHSDFSFGIIINETIDMVVCMNVKQPTCIYVKQYYGLTYHIILKEKPNHTFIILHRLYFVILRYFQVQVIFYQVLPSVT